MADVRDALDALSVAHDALIEGRPCDAMDGMPLWSRPERLLSSGFRTTFKTILGNLMTHIQTTFGNTVDDSYVRHVMAQQARTMSRLHEDLTRMGQTIIIDGDYLLS